MSSADTSMSSVPGSRTDSSSTSNDSRGPNDREAPDPAELRQQGQLFRSLMDTPLTARQLASWADAGTWSSADEGDDSHQDTPYNSHDAPVDVSAMLQARHVIDAGPGVLSSATPASAPDPSLAELIEKHVRRVLASVDATGSSDGEVRIELSDAVFPGTELSLKRTEGGWQLIATANNRQSLEALHHFAPALVERFAQASLGKLTLVEL